MKMTAQIGFLQGELGHHKKLAEEVSISTIINYAATLLHIRHIIREMMFVFGKPGNAPACWFFEITFLQTHVCLYMCTLQRLLITTHIK